MPAGYLDLENIRRERSVVVAMSGGVDSAAASLLLRDAGFEVTGLTMKNFCFGEPDLPEKSCCSLEAMEEARRVCDQLGVAHEVVDVGERFTSEVIRDFVSEYEKARTPNPCVRCNAAIRFRALVDFADRCGIHYIATGHYARIYRTSGGALRLARSRSVSKDQSYFLSPLRDRFLLERILLPIGAMEKEEVRKLANSNSLSVAEKIDSQEVCFMAGGTLKSFLTGRVDFRPGPIESTRGEVIGRHEGLALYTIGQRRKLGIAAGTPRYVVGLDSSRNVLIVGEEEDLYKQGLLCKLHWLDDTAAGEPEGVSAQIRSRHKASPVREINVREESCRVVFESPQKAVCPGQTIAFYKENFVVGSGIIESAIAA